MGLDEATTLRELATILGVGTALQLAAWRLRLPSILLLLCAGLLLGPVAQRALGDALVHPDRLLGGLLLPLTSLSVAVILFEGGLTLQLHELRSTGRSIWAVVTVGALVRWVLTAALAWGLGLLEAPLALLLGAVLVVTGPTVIGPLLEHIRPRGAVATVLKWEGIIIDPIGATLTVLVYEAITAGALGAGLAHAARGLVETTLVGLALGGAGAAALTAAVRRRWVPEALESAAALALVVVTFVAANALHHESGILAVTVLGVAAGNALGAEAHRILEFKETVRGILIACLFVVLAARVDLDALAGALSWRALAFLALLVLVVRPAGVLVATVGSGLSGAERVFLAGVAPRGIVAAAVSAVFALRLAERGFAQAPDIAALTFVVVIGTVAVYGLGAAPLARRLGLAAPDPQGLLLVGAHPWARALAESLGRAGARVTLVDSNAENVAQARLGGLDAVQASALSDAVGERVDLSGVGHALALTSNDEVNGVACGVLARVVGGARAFRLAPRRAPAHLRGVVALGGLSFDELARRHAEGQAFRATPLTEAFTEARWRETHGADAVPVAVLAPDGRVTVVAHGGPIGARPGDVLVGLAAAASATTPAA